jgi:hypothetical protein
MFITCRQQETIAEFHEKVPEERRDILQRKVSRKGVAGIDYKYGSSSGYAGGSKSIQTEKSTIADELQDGSQDQMLIKKATISFDVKDYSKARKRIVDIIKSNDAYI